MSTEIILHRDLSYEIVGALFDVHNVLGPGWDEYAYHLALLESLSSRGLVACGKLGGVLKHRNIVADVFELDILVEQRVILELKHLDKGFADAHFVQILNYLKFWSKTLGLLVNFGLHRLRHQRLPCTPVSGKVQRKGEWPAVPGGNPFAQKICEMFEYLLMVHGLGYGVETNRKLFRTECEFNGIPCTSPPAALKFRERSLGKRSVKAFLVGDESLVLIAAHRNEPTARDLARLTSYVKALAKPYGILANFGSTELTLQVVVV